nr:hypothetical protein [Saccharopolyspora spinosa]
MTTSRQLPSTLSCCGWSFWRGSTMIWAVVSTAKAMHATHAIIRKSTASSAAPSSGPTSVPACAKTLNTANASARRSPASCMR